MGNDHNVVLVEFVNIVMKDGSAEQEKMLIRNRLPHHPLYKHDIIDKEDDKENCPHPYPACQHRLESEDGNDKTCRPVDPQMLSSVAIAVVEFNLDIQILQDDDNQQPGPYLPRRKIRDSVQ